MDKKLMQLEFTEGWTQTEIPELKLWASRDTEHVHTLAQWQVETGEEILESFLQAAPASPSGQLSPRIKGWGPRGRFAQE